MSQRVVDRETRVRIQAMLDVETAEMLKSEALRKGLSVSAMAGMLIKQALEDYDSSNGLTSADDMDHRIRKILSVAEREGLL